MATFQKRGSKWRAIVRRKGFPTSTESFDTKTQAERWARKIEADMDAGVTRVITTSMTMAQALERYTKEVAPKKRGSRWELLRLDFMSRTLDFLLVPIHEVTDIHLDAWKVKRLKQVSNATVNREINLLGAVFTAAMKDWKIRMPCNPISLIRRPQQPKNRRRRITTDESQKIINELCGGKPNSKKWLVGMMFRLAQETGMRKGEMIGLRWEDVHETYIHVHISKNGDARDIPLTAMGRKIMAELSKDTLSPFDVLPTTADATFRKTVEKLKIKDLHFHDTRHEACSRLAQKLSVLELSAVIGHRDIRSLQVYYNPTVQELAEKLG